MTGRKARWEALCRRCGLCCYEKEYRGSTVVTNFNRPCPHLDLPSRLCTIYESRFAACARCKKMTVLHAMFVRWLPPTCGYVQHYRLWRAAVERPNVTGYRDRPNVRGYRDRPNVTGYRDRPNVTGYRDRPNVTGYRDRAST